MIKVVLAALFVSGGVYAEVFSQSSNGLFGLAEENAASLLNLTTNDCAKRPESKCYGVVVNADEDDDSSSELEVEVATGWVNRAEPIE